MATDLADYNTQLTQCVRNFRSKYTDLGSITLFDTQLIINALLDEWQTFGFVNVTGCTPTSSYFWLNSFHALFTVHDILAKIISTALAEYPFIQIIW